MENFLLHVPSLSVVSKQRKAGLVFLRRFSTKQLLAVVSTLRTVCYTTVMTCYANAVALGSALLPQRSLYVEMYSTSQ